jgi:hypothetical protein
MAYEEALGADVSSLLTRGASALKAASKVIEDPALPQITCHVLRLNKITRNEDPGPPCPKIVLTEAQRRKGVGLAAAEKPLRAFVWARKNPAIAIGIGVGVVGMIWYVGYAMGKRKR